MRKSYLTFAGKLLRLLSAPYNTVDNQYLPVANQREREGVWV